MGAVPPYRRIAAGIAARIAAGELAPGDRVPSTRQLIADHGIAMATATKVIATLREQGLVRTRPGVGTVVATPAHPRPSPSQHGRIAPAVPDRERVVRTAVAVADAEGLGALSMRRLAGELGMPTMSLYRHVSGKEELLLFMMDTVFAGDALPALSPGTDGWRACVEALARLQWSMYRRHPWLAQAVSFTRPLLAPRAMAHTEWTMRALDGHGLAPDVLFLAAVTVANYVRGTAVNIEEEAQAEQETGMSEEQWLDSQQNRLGEILGSGRYPLMHRAVADPELEFDVDRLMEFGLQRLLDGLAPVLDGQGRSRRS
ncbi:TetR/AcrR family transcriptional regulator C-terminal domain-containing protein [Actinoplanes auranticolor]|uniref:GntR family transcriptional regulator n=1 Tax=Actinoplanes auranticolor TaxID=47988 RepID=A0A919VVZ3_9ACTN|nr:TetR/AcrR family transcriptional regulator C-terminal domain-containing protein [Actinoplanes auranticolor]GIM78881.1 GntR family transcriptional regulator [Actinoplanes auranticolor]